MMFKKRWVAALLLGLAGLVWTATGQSTFNYDNPQVKTLLNQGDSRRKVDLVFIGDGYTANQTKELEKDARAALDSLFRYPFFKDYRSYFNAHLVVVPSIQETVTLRYAFGSVRDNTRGLVRLSENERVREVARKAPDCDLPIVLSTMLGRAHASDIVVLPGRDYSPLPHELGHALGGLGDEYDSSSSLADRRSTSGTRDLHYPNLTLGAFIDPTSQQSIRKTAKWGHFLDLPGAYPLVSAYQGGYYQAIGVWRPTFSCIMGSDGAPFCPVCHEEMVKAIFKICGETFNDAAYHRRHPLSQWR